MSQPDVARAPRWRTSVAVVLVVLATLLSPVAVVAGWAKLELTSTDAFVSTFAPLASDPAVQATVSDQVVDAIESRIDIDGLTQQAFDAVAGLNVPPRASTALQALAVPAANGIKSMIQRYVDEFVQSDAFQGLWTQTLRTAHATLLDAQDGSLRNGGVTIDQNGQVALQLGPVIAQVKTVLVARGVPLAAQIPTVDRSIVIANVDAAPKVRLAYGLAVAAGVWLPVVVLLLFAAAVLVANRRRRMLVASACCLFGAMLVTGLLIRVGRFVTVTALSPATMTSDAARAIYTQTVVMLRSSVLAVGALAVVTAVVAWLCAPRGLPARLRGAGGDLAGSVRTAGDRHGVSTGPLGEWVHAHLSLLLWAVAVLSVVTVVLLRPLTVGILAWIVLVDLVVVLALGLVQRPPVAGGTAPDELSGAGPA